MDDDVRLDAGITGEALAHAKASDVVITGKPVELVDDDTFTVDVPIPPLHRPGVECMLEKLESRDCYGYVKETAWRASPSDRMIKVGGVRVVLVSGMSAVGDTRDKAVEKLSTAVGQAVAQAYVHLLTSDEPEKREAARSMEIGS